MVYWLTFGKTLLRKPYCAYWILVGWKNESYTRDSRLRKGESMGIDSLNSLGEFSEKKRRVYDQYGKDGLQMPGGKRRHGDDFDPHFASTFVFRDPEEVFREFFDGSPFEDLLAGKKRRCQTSNVTHTQVISFKLTQVSTAVGHEGALRGGTVTRLITVWVLPSSGRSDRSVFVCRSIWWTMPGLRGTLALSTPSLASTARAAALLWSALVLPLVSSTARRLRRKSRSRNVEARLNAKCIIIIVVNARFNFSSAGSTKMGKRR